MEVLEHRESIRLLDENVRDLLSLSHYLTYPYRKNVRVSGGGGGSG